MGQIDHAINKFESTKKQIENEIVYENPYLFIELCTQLANCWLKKAKEKFNFEINDLCRSEPYEGSKKEMIISALDNFESALCLINRVEGQIDNKDFNQQ